MEKYGADLPEAQDIRLALLDHKLFYEHSHHNRTGHSEHADIRKALLRKQKKDLILANEAIRRFRDLQEYLQTRPGLHAPHSEREAAFIMHIRSVHVGESSLFFHFHCGLEIRYDRRTGGVYGD